MPDFPDFNYGYLPETLAYENREPFDPSDPSKVLCTCGYWRGALDRFEHTSECPAFHRQEQR